MKDKMLKANELKKTIASILNTKDYKDQEEHTNQLKSLLFFVGKEVLISFQKKTNHLTIDKDSHVLESKYSLWKPDIVMSLESIYGNLMDINICDREKILKIIDSMDIESIKDFSLGELYEGLVTAREKKYLGQVYTPENIVRHMVKSNILEKELINNPYYKVIDPACGGGYFLIECYERIKGIFEKNIEVIALKNPMAHEELKRGIHQFILKHNLWGADIDDFAVFMTTISLTMKEIGSFINPLVFKMDILLSDPYDENNGHSMVNRFNLVIGNPPYIGHKKIDKHYRDKLSKKYNEVYSDKSDISYCFFKRGYELLDKEGRLSYITSRYFMEALSARGLRGFVKDKFSIETIVDFYGENPFKGIGISPIIVSCTKNELVENKVHIYKLRGNVNEKDIAISPFLKGNFEEFYIRQVDLEDKDWIVVNYAEKKVYEKIHMQGEYFLSDICKCNQGIITGNDKAFIVNQESVINEGLETEIIRPWIKNSSIEKYRMSESSMFILYTDDIEDLSRYRSTIKHLMPYKEKLSKRRECSKGVRKWYKLQWGRELKYFLTPKIVFPYKAQKNRFAIDYDGTLCSADVYVINIINNEISLEFLLGFLNSSLFEFYFKVVAKKLGKNLYEYYPNKIMSLMLKFAQDKGYIEDKVRGIINLYMCLNTKGCHEEKIKMDIDGNIKSIDKFFYELYDISNDEIEIIENRIKS